jgi:plasmid stabilization system protein ParE
MKVYRVVYTEDALKDIGAIADWLIVRHPDIAPTIERRIRRAIANVAQWPESARRSATYPGLRATSLGRYSYGIFYRVADDTLEILHIHYEAVFAKFR